MYLRIPAGMARRKPQEIDGQAGRATRSYLAGLKHQDESFRSTTDLPKSGNWSAASIIIFPLGFILLPSLFKPLSIR